MLVKQRCYDRAIVKKFFLKLKTMSVMVDRKKNSMRDQNTNPFQLVIQSLSQSPHQSIQQFTSKKRITLYYDFVPRPLNFLLGTCLVNWVANSSFLFYPRNGSTSFVGCDSHCKANTHCTVQLRHQRKR